MRSFVAISVCVDLVYIFMNYHYLVDHGELRATMARRFDET